MKIGERGGLIQLFGRLVAPFFRRVFPDIPPGHPASGSIVMNFSANMLGLDNAATLLGLKAMRELQEINPKPDTASNPMIMFLVLNTAGITLVSPPRSSPSARASRVKRGLVGFNAADIFLPTPGTFRFLLRRPGRRGCLATHQPVQPAGHCLLSPVLPR